jgi:hypothetical protein
MCIWTIVYLGKGKIFDGRTGDTLEQPVLIGKSYILKLIHQDNEKKFKISLIAHFVISSSKNLTKNDKMNYKSET